MSSHKTLYLFLCSILLSFNSYSQEPATLIEKNIMRTSLLQTLNEAKDTLTLKNESDILRVTFINHKNDRETVVDIMSKEVKIPLYHFEVGRFTISTYIDNDIVLLGMTRVSNIRTPKDATVDLEESILRSSLSEEEQVYRNLKPLKPNAGAVAKSNPEKTRKAKPKALDAKMNVRESRIAELERKRKEKLKKRKAIIERKIRARKSKKIKNEKTKEGLLALSTKKEVTEKEDIIAEASDTKEVIDNDKRTGRLASGKRREIEQEKVSYNISVARDETVMIQTREEYRKNHLRPNGKKYDD